MNGMRKYFSQSVWSPVDVGAFLFVALAILALPALVPELKRSSLIASLFGAAVLRHFTLHGWTLLRGSLAQRALLIAILFCAVLAGAMVAAIIGL